MAIVSQSAIGPMRPSGYYRLTRKMSGMARLDCRPNDGKYLESYCRWLVGRGFRLMIALDQDFSEETRAAWMKAHAGNNYVLIPVPDLTTPKRAQIGLYLRLARSCQFGRVITHCTAGIGRTGTFLAAYALIPNLDDRDP